MMTFVDNLFRTVVGINLLHQKLIMYYPYNLGEQNYIFFFCHQDVLITGFSKDNGPIITAKGECVSNFKDRFV